ncbi:hypothetical protein [Martelella radicis]|uniref:Phosphoglycerol transferase MdoB-like AlkP superfamily enzyme n=1 Tax=Martelella radicis TaxID=1397476 RepID=A0A7W6KLQ6_9HYPH|nr:hypothetical protein [Martelella radicis]MBB4122183.1 phosphoglycerol transferase MdoB-like AlkP superfamily enzyme [Martelella radicis]
MTNNRATRRYFSVMFPALVVFLATSFAINRVSDHTPHVSVAIMGLMAIAIAALLAFFWAHLRYVREIDEFLRIIQIRAIIAGLAVVFSLATALGYLELYGDVDTISLFWLNPIYWLSYAVAALYLTWRETGSLG